MRVNPYVEPLLRNVTDLLNRPPTSVSDCVERWTAGGMPPRPAGRTGELRLVRGYLRRWSAVVDAATDTDRVTELNTLLHRFSARPSITDHDASGWHLHYRDPDAGFAATLAGATTAAAAQFLTDRGMHRLGRCDVPECRLAYVDFSRPGRQRYCSQPCANRDAVRRHRAARLVGHR